VDTGTGSCQACAGGTFSTGGAACQPFSVTMFECNSDNKVFVPGASDGSTDSSCGAECASGLVADGEICKQGGAAMTCGTLSWMYFSDVCCESQENTIGCVASLGESEMKLVDSVTTLKQADGSDCVDGMVVAFTGGRLVCKAS